MSFLLTFLFAGSFYAAGPSMSAPQIAVDSVHAMTAVRSDETEVTEGTYPLTPDGRVSVSNLNGSVEVTGWDRPEVKIVATKVANNKERLKDLEVEIISEGDSFRVEVDYRRNKGKWVKGDKLYVNFKLMVPRTAVVSEIESVNGEVVVAGLTNEIKVSAVNGSVKGSALLGKITLSTVNGVVHAGFDRFNEATEVFLSSVNGGARISVPSDVNATVKADTVNGSITNDFGLQVKKGKFVGSDMYGTIGSGDVKIQLNTVNGSIKINRNEDGLTPNPVKNLLPQKTSDDFDDVFDQSSNNERQENRIRVETEKVIRESIRATREAEREVLRQSTRIASEAASVTTEELAAALASLGTVEVDRPKIEAEIAAMARTLTGTKPAPFILEDSKTVEVEGIPTVEVDASGCNITVKGWERNEVRYVVSRLARGRTSPVKHVGFSHEESVINLNVEVIVPPESGQLLEQVRVELFVPRKANLRIDTDREIRLEGVTGDLDLNGSHGQIDVRDAAGNLDVESKEGTVRVIGFEGELDSRLGSADMYLDGDFRKIVSNSYAGTVYLRIADDPGAMIRTNSMGLSGINAQKGKPVMINGMRFLQKQDDMWQIGNGAADFDFRFKSGSLIVRPKIALSSE